MKKLFVFATLGVLSLSSFKSNEEKKEVEVVTVGCRITAYYHDSNGKVYVRYFSIVTDTAATCYNIANSL